MRLSMKSYTLPNIASSPSPHVPTHHQHCSIATLTQQLTFQAQQSIHHQSLRDFESMSLDPVHPIQQTGPKARVSDRWEEFMGLKDWAGLLDPLDENLSHEILRYGNFIEAAYRAFDFDPESPSYGSCKYKKRSLLENCGLPNSGYRISRHLRATSGIPVPEWAQSSWAAAQSSWIGFVAISNNKGVIDRLGRREVVISLRGTATCLEWLENLRATLAPVPGPSKIKNNGNNVSPWDQDGPPMVESGFLSLYTSGTDMWPSLQDAIRKEVGQILEEYKDEPLSITITGHSLGAALAKIAAYDIKTTFEKAPLVTVVSFGGPRVGNKSFRSLVDRQGTKILRVVNPSDLITKVPGFVVDNSEEFVNKKRRTTGKKYTKISHHNYKSKCNSNSNTNSYSNSKMRPLAGFIHNWIKPFQVEDKQWWVYAEVGRELRLENMETEQQLPYNLSNMNVAKCHDLKTYLNLVEICPIRAFVKRSFNKLSHRCKHKNDDTSVLVA